ncbi:MAG TPA: sulfatase-like hydrolase/transferase [Opitutaceae bacterium]
MKTPRCLTFILCALAAATGPASAAEKFNIIVILTDDQAPWTLGAYGGVEGVSPNLDRLARGGARFDRAFVDTPVCSPSRATFFTGRHGTQLGITDWISEEEEEDGLGLPESAVTWPELLQKAGWRTALIGKWHLGRKPQFHPTRHGFDHFYGLLGAGTGAMKPTFDFPDGPRQLEGCTADLITDDALRFIAEHREGPFAISLHFREPHEPYGPMPKEDQDAVAKLPLTLPDLPGLDRVRVERDTRAYLAAVHALDRNIGRLIAAIDEQGLAERTILLFTSDHGYHIGQHLVEGKGNAHWIAGGVRGPRRPNLWDLSLRVPLLIRWPGVTQPGQIVPQMVSNLDTFATVLAMLGVPAPAVLRTEGLDLTPLLRGEPTPARDALFAQYDLHNTASARMRAVRTEKWKLVRRYDAERLDELYDLEKDPDEMRNLMPLVRSRPAPPELAPVIADLDRRLHDWMHSIGDPLAR